jgi:hypothetical protein
LRGDKAMKKTIILFSILLLSVNYNSISQGKKIDGWFKAGSKPDSYVIGKDEKLTYNNLPSYYLKSDSVVGDGFGTIMKGIPPDEYLGKRIKLTGYIKTENIEDWAGMWMRIDSKIPNKMLGFDNMNNRPIKGTNDWTKYEIVLDVPDSSMDIAYGVLINGTGTVSFPELALEVVGTDVPTTNMLKE